MTNATTRATAAPMPTLDRRAALSTIAAAGAVLVAPKIAKAAATDDADIFAAIDHVRALLRAQEEAGERLSALNRLLPCREELPGLRARKNDPAIFKTEKSEGELLEHRDITAARSMIRALRTCGIDESNTVFGTGYARAVEVDQAEIEFCRRWDETRERLGYDEVEEAWNDAVCATDKAAKALLDKRPKTVAGLRAIMLAIRDVNYYECSDDGEALQSFLLEAPALTAI